MVHAEIVHRRPKISRCTAPEDTLAQLGGTLDKPLQQHASYLAAKAEVELAERNVRLTRVLAPFAGTARWKTSSREVFAVGDPASTLIGADAWVNSNIKETDLTQYQGWRSLPRSCSIPIWTSPCKASFALLPAQNAAGNWVKVVQRMPVRIKITKPHPGRGDA